MTTLKISFSVEKDISVSRDNLVGFPHLIQLGVSFTSCQCRGNVSWENDAMCSLLFCSPQLQSLKVISYSSSHDEFIPLISYNLTELTLQSYGCCGGDHLTKLLSQCSTLKKLNVTNSHFSKDQVINDIVSSPLVSTLVHLDLRGNSVTVDGVKKLLETNLELKYLNLLHCSDLPMPSRKVYTKEKFQEFYCDITREPDVIIEWLS